MARLYPGGTEPLVRVDGNAIAGALSEIFATDMTVASLTCGHCGRTAMLAVASVELDDDGFIVLCRSCDHTLFTGVRREGQLSIYLQNVTALTVQR